MKKLFVTVALGAAFLSAPTLAQGGGGGGVLQKDQTRAEAQQRTDMMFQMLDANHDGTVRAPRPTRRWRISRRRAARMAVMAADGCNA